MSGNGRRSSSGGSGRSLGVLLAVPWDQPAGGVASVVGNLARHLEERGHRPVFLHPEGGRTRERRTAQDFRGYAAALRSPEPRLRSRVAYLADLPFALARLTRLIRRERIDVVNVHYPVAQFAAFAPLRKVVGTPLVVSVHGADLFPGGRAADRYRPWLLRLLESADRVVSPSRSFLEEVCDVFPSVREKGRAILNGMDLDEIAGEEGDSGAGDEGEAPYVLCIAAHNDKKAIEVLLEAFALLPDRYGSFRLELIGGGPLLDRNRERARTLGIEHRVAFRGIQQRASVRRFLRGATAFALPSRAEPFGIVVIEAMAAGLPVVASAVGGIREIVTPGEDGLLVPPDDAPALAEALTRVLDDGELRQRLSRSAAARVRERFSYRETGSAYESLYRELGD